MIDASWSYSAYSMAVQCARKYKLCFVDKIIPDTAESGDMVFGSAIHSAVNAILSGEDGQAVFETYWLSYKDSQLDFGRFKWDYLAKCGATLLRKFSETHAKEYGLVFAEKRLFGEYKGVKLEGTLDFYGSYKGQFGVRDFKTSSNNYHKEKSAMALQIYLYAYLYLENNLGARLETLGYTVFNKALASIQQLTWDFDSDTMFEALDDLVAYTKLLQNKEGPDYPRNLNACLDYNRPCQYWDLCHKNKTGASDV